MKRLLSLILAFFATSALAVDIPMRNPSSGGKITLPTAAVAKQYVAGTAYTNGTPNVTSGQAGFSVGRMSLIPYQTSDGSWHLRFMGAGSFTTATISSLTITVSGVTFKTGTNFYQEISASWDNSSAAPIAYTNQGAGTLAMGQSSSISVNGWHISGDVELDSKPTWAD
jgi:hypothetical protein